METGVPTAQISIKNSMNIKNTFKISDLFKFLSTSLKFMAQDRIWIILVIGTSVIAAIIEALAASMVAPLIASQSNSASFSNTPFLGKITALFDNYEVNEKLEIIALVLLILFVLRGISQYAVQAINTLAPVIMRRRLVLNGYSSIMNAELTYINQRAVGNHTVNLDSHPSWISNA